MKNTTIDEYALMLGFALGAVTVIGGLLGIIDIPHLINQILTWIANP